MDAKRYYVVLHGNVNGWPQGSVLTAEELLGRIPSPDDEGLRRLIGLGAVCLARPGRTLTPYMLTVS